MCLFPSLFSSILIVKMLDLVYYCVMLMQKVDVKNVMIKPDGQDKNRHHLYERTKSD